MAGGGAVVVVVGAAVELVLVGAGVEVVVGASVEVVDGTGAVVGAAVVDGAADVGEVDVDVVPAAWVAVSSWPSSHATPPTAPKPNRPAMPISSLRRV